MKRKKYKTPNGMSRETRFVPGEPGWRILEMELLTVGYLVGNRRGIEGVVELVNTSESLEMRWGWAQT